MAERIQGIQQELLVRRAMTMSDNSIIELSALRPVGIIKLAGYYNKPYPYRCDQSQNEI